MFSLYLMMVCCAAASSSFVGRLLHWRQLTGRAATFGVSASPSTSAPTIEALTVDTRSLNLCCPVQWHSLKMNESYQGQIYHMAKVGDCLNVWKGIKPFQPPGSNQQEVSTMWKLAIKVFSGWRSINTSLL